MATVREATKEQVEYAKTIPQEIRQGMYLKAVTGNSLRKAINAMCYECNGWENAPKRTDECDIEKCPLWSFRRRSRKG